jgi:hypothetical protein
VAPDGLSCAIAASDGRHAEVVKHGSGTHWVVAACLENRGRFQEMVLDASGPAGELADALVAADVRVRRVTLEERKAACAQLLTAVTDRTLIHLGQPELDSAAGNADRAISGDGGWYWSRRKSSVDISPLYAVSLARWAAVNAPDYDVLASVL